MVKLWSWKLVKGTKHNWHELSRMAPSIYIYTSNGHVNNYVWYFFYSLYNAIFIHIAIRARLCVTASTNQLELMGRDLSDAFIHRRTIRQTVTIPVGTTDHIFSLPKFHPHGYEVRFKYKFGICATLKRHFWYRWQAMFDPMFLSSDYPPPLSLLGVCEIFPRVTKRWL
jgi:hypothetical protein